VPCRAAVGVALRVRIGSKLLRLALSLIAVALVAIGLVACQPAQARGPGGTKLAQEIVIPGTSEEKAEFVNKGSFATPNDAALPFIDPEIANNPAIFPPRDSLVKAEAILPLSPDGEKLYADIWQRFEAGRP
jgi:spermidine/putrescine-binding protein